MLLSGISEADACIEVAARFWYLGVRMLTSPSVSSSADPAEIKNTPPSIQLAVPVRDHARSVSSTDRSLYGPVNGFVGRCFIRVCLWADLVVSWKRRSYTVPQRGFPNLADSEPESEAGQHAVAS